MNKDDTYLSLRDAARLLRISYGTLATWAREGSFPAVRLGAGRSYRIRHSDLDAWYDGRRAAGQG